MKRGNVCGSGEIGRLAEGRRRLPGKDGTARFAALDLGTNNCRLLVAEPSVDGFEVVDSFSRITRLGQGLVVRDRLSEAAMARTLAALKVCQRIIERNHVRLARCVATEACRRAINGTGFLARVRRVTGLDLELLSHEEEARLAMLGCLPLVDEEADHLLMLDIGGGSTELVWLDRGPRGFDADACQSISLPLGVVTLSESFAGPDRRRYYRRMVEMVAAGLNRARLEVGLGSPARTGRIQLLGTSGTLTTLAAVHLGLRRYDRGRVDGLRLPFAAIQAVGEELRQMDDRTRAANPCIGAGRADLVVAGCAILDAIHHVWPVGWLRVADRGVREGILHTLMGRSLRQGFLDLNSAA